MANLRTFLYEGFAAASASVADSKPGWMFWSGSKDMTGSVGTTTDGLNTNYTGIGLEAILNSESFLRFSASSAGSGLEVRTNTFFLGSEDAFISGSGDGSIAISSSFFELANDGSVIMQGSITATAGGTIGGWEIGDTALSSSNDTVLLDSNGPYFISASGFQVGNAGTVTASAGQISGWIIENGQIRDNLGTTNPTIFLQSGASPKIRLQNPTTATPAVEMQYIDADNVAFRGLNSNGSEVFYLGYKDAADFNQIAGWKFDNNKIISNLGNNSANSPGIVINSNGTIETDPFISGLTANATGWQIRSDGRAEFENAVIRGTLSTAVFEKDTVSVVGGQVMVANASKLDKPTERHVFYPHIRSTESHSINYSGEELPPSIAYGDTNATITAGESHDSNLWFKVENTTNAKGKFVFPISTGSSATNDGDVFRLTIYAASSSTNQVINFYNDATSANVNLTASDGTIGINSALENGLNVFYLTQTSDFGSGGKFIIKNNSNLSGQYAYVRDIHVVQVSQSLTVDNAGGWISGEIAVAKATDQGPDGRQGFVREYMQIISGSNGTSASPATRSISYGSITNDTTNMRFLVTASAYHTFTSSTDDPLPADQPQINRYYFGLGSSRAQTVANFANKINGEIPDVYAKTTGSAGQSIYMQSVDVDTTDGNGYGIRQHTNPSINLEGAIARVKPTLIVQRNMDALVAGNERGYWIEKMSDGQSMASQGSEGTGYILMNADPNDTFSPYIDIVERSNMNTGSIVQDYTDNNKESIFGEVQTTVRVGDLSGITDYSFSDGVSGYGIYTTNGYFRGKIEVGAQPQQPPEDTLFLHYDFKQTTGSYILDQTPNSFTASFIVSASTSNTVADQFLLGSSGVLTMTSSDGSLSTTSPSLKGPGILETFGVISSSQAIGSNSFSVGYRFRLNPGTLPNDNMHLINAYPNFMLRIASGYLYTQLYTGSIADIIPTSSMHLYGNTEHDGRVISLGSGATKAYVSESILYHAFVTAKENDKMELYLFDVDNEKLCYYQTASLAGKYFGFMEHASYTDVRFARAGWTGTDSVNQSFRGQLADIRLYNQQALTENQCIALALNSNTNAGGTIIEGDSIQTGRLKSNNYGSANGSMFDLNAGTFQLGGSDPANTKLDWDGTTLTIKGNISLEAGSTLPDGSPITSTKTVDLSATQNIIVYNAAGDNGSGTITLIASSSNFTDARFKITGGGAAFTDDTSYNDGITANTTESTFTIPTNYSATPYSFNVSVQEGTSGGEVASDTITIASVKPGTQGVDGTSGTDGADGSDGADGADGADAYTVLLTNESHTMPSASNGTVDHTGTGTSIIVYKGANELDGVVGSATTTGKFSVTASGVNITPSSTHGTSTGNPVVYADHNSYNGGTDPASVNYTVNIEGMSTTFIKSQSLSVAPEGAQGIQGIQGIQGNPGADNQDFSWANENLTGIGPIASAGLFMSSNVFGFHNGIAGSNGTLSDFKAYLDSSGNLVLGSGGATSLTWDQGAGTLDIVGTGVTFNVSKFFMGSATQYIGAGGVGGVTNFEISSSQFHVEDSTGNVYADGYIRAKGLRMKTVTVGTGNSSLYLSRHADGSDGYLKLLADGSGGGDVATHFIIDRDCADGGSGNNGVGSGGYDRPIVHIVAPTVSGESLPVTIEVANNKDVRLGTISSNTGTGNLGATLFMVNQSGASFKQGATGGGASYN